MKSLLLISGMILFSFSPSYAEQYEDLFYGWSLEPPKDWNVGIHDDAEWGRVVVFTSNDDFSGDFAPYFAVIRVVDERTLYDPTALQSESDKQVFVRNLIYSFLQDETFSDLIIGYTNIQKLKDGYVFDIRNQLLYGSGEMQQFIHVNIAGFWLTSDEMYLFVFFSDLTDLENAEAKFYDSIKTFEYPTEVKSIIPDWIRNNARWWSKGQIEDSDFISGIQYLIKNEIIIIPNETSNPITSQEIPVWIRNNAEWWSTGQISDHDFLRGIQYLIKNGIIVV